MYCSWDRAPAAYTIDSLSIKWDNMWGYVYPPISLVPQVLQKMRLKAVRSENLVGSSLMAPQALVPRAARPFGGHPSILPTQTEAVTAEPKCNVLPDVEWLKLTVWPLSKNSLLRREFFKEQDRWSWPPGDQEPSGYIQHSTEFSVAGVVGSLKVPLRHL